MFLIVHIDPAGLESIGFDKSKYEKILGRYHELEFHITEDAAYDLIGGSIIPKAGMEKQWEDEKKKKVAELADYSHEFDNLSLNGKSITERLVSLAPIHPMTLTLLAVVAQNFGASQRTLFRFMKDPDKKSENIGFIHYIENNEPDEWGWLTPNFLWDYFFTRESDSNRATNGRIVVVACCNEKSSIEARLGELKAELDKYEFKIGLFVIVISDAKHYIPLQSTAQELSEEDTTGRIAICLIKTELTDTQLERWYAAKTHEELSNEDGKNADKNRYEEEGLTVRLAIKTE